MEVLEKIKIATNKKMLFIFGGLIWAFAGGRVITLGIKAVIEANNLIICSLISLFVFYIFYNKIFMKLVDKHVSRINKSELERHCIFSFFDFKSYMIMAFMITFSVILRKLNLVEPKLLGSFYVGLGTALFTSGIMFSTFGLRR